MMSVSRMWVRQLTATPYDQISPSAQSYPSPDVMLRIDLHLISICCRCVSGSVLPITYGRTLLWYLIAKEFELRNIRLSYPGLIEGFLLNRSAGLSSRSGETKKGGNFGIEEDGYRAVAWWNHMGYICENAQESRAHLEACMKNPDIGIILVSIQLIHDFQSRFTA
jgi:hypothetical protein